MSLSIEEQETHVNFNRDDERATIYTSDTTMMTKLNKLVDMQNTEWKVDKVSRLKRTGEVIGITYSCPVQFISFRTKRVKRTYTEDQKKKIASNLHNKINSTL